MIRGLQPSVPTPSWLVVGGGSCSRLSVSLSLPCSLNILFRDPLFPPQNGRTDILIKQECSQTVAEGLHRAWAQLWRGWAGLGTLVGHTPVQLSLPSSFVLKYLLGTISQKGQLSGDLPLESGSLINSLPFPSKEALDLSWNAASRGQLWHPS